MTINRVNFTVGEEDLSDIYVSKEKVISDAEDGSIPQTWLSQQGKDDILNKSLWAWGGAANGQLGLITVVNRSSPVQVGAIPTWVSISAGTNHSLSVETDGSIWSWGLGTDGILGLNSVVSRSSPVQVGLLTDWRSIAGGAAHSLATKTNGTLWSWGINNYAGPLGLNDIVNRSSPTQVGLLTTWKSVASGDAHSLAIKTDGTLWTWGRSNNGQTGLNATANRSSPTQVGSLSNWKQAAGGVLFSRAVKTDGTLWAWGEAGRGLLGLNNAVVGVSSPVQVGSLTNWKSVSTGGVAGLFSHAVKTDGTLWAWGYNNIGQLGLNDIVHRSSPVQVGALTNWDKVSGGANHAAAIKTDGTLWAWGLNSSGQLGLTNVVNRSSPVQVGVLTNWKSVFSGGTHNLARR